MIMVLLSVKELARRAAGIRVLDGYQEQVQYVPESGFV
jgi:hypothetical protein